MEKKILASDFDGTMTNPCFLDINIRDTGEDDILKINVDEIKKFVKNGNIFMLNTGRPYDSIIEVIKKYDIPYDYLSCTDGSLLLDKEGNIIHSYEIISTKPNYELILEILKTLQIKDQEIKNIKLLRKIKKDLPINQYTYYIDLYEVNEKVINDLKTISDKFFLNLEINRNQITLKHKEVWDVILLLHDKYPNIKFKPILYKDLLLEYELEIEGNKSGIDEIKRELKRFCLVYNFAFKSFDDVEFYISRNDISKSTSINEIRYIENIEKCDIFTIGDQLNDLEMVRDFNGYTVPWGKQALKDVSYGICPTVAELIKRIS